MAEPYSLTIEMPGLPQCNTASNRHWAARMGHNRRWARDVAVMATGRRPPKPLELASLECIRCSTREPDYDNLVQSFKPLVDGLVRCGVLLDDNSSVIVEREYRWEKAKRGQGCVRITVREIPQEDEAA